MATGSTGAVVAYGAIGLLVGWFIAVRVVERLPDPQPLAPAGRIATTAVTGVLFGLVARKLAPVGPGYVVPTLLFVGALVVVSAIDLRVYRIPDKVTFPTLALALPAILVGGLYDLGRQDGAIHARNAVLGMVVYFVALFLPHLVYPRGMGFGDVKLGLVMGAYLGWFGHSVLDVVQLVLIALMLGCIIGVVMGLVTNIVRRRGGHFPFGPALALGAIYVVLTFEKYLTGL